MNRLWSLSICVFALSAVQATTSVAQDAGYSSAPTQTCLADLGRREDKRACVGVAAHHCAQSGETQSCLTQEAAYWDVRLEAAYNLSLLRAHGKDSDAKSLEIQPRHQAKALEGAQTAWITYRDATCAFEESFWVATGPESAEALFCQMTLTAEQAFYFEAVALIE